MVDGTPAPERVPPPDPGEPPDPHDHAGSAGDHDPARVARKKAKVRAAWIAFVSRILAQVIGAVATVALGLYVVRSYGVDRRPPSSDAVAHESRPFDPAADSRDTVTLVVLPFDEFASGAPADRFTDGLTDTLIAELARAADVRLISRTSSMLYKGSTKALPAIARELQADLVVEGAVTRDGDRVRVTGQLIDAATDTHLWAGQYDGRGGDALAVQRAASQALTQQIHAVITPWLEARAARRAGLGPDAHAHYVRGRQAFERRTPSDLADATAELSRAAALAPTFAPARAALATVWCLRAVDAFGASAAREALDRADEEAREAVRLDAANADAHVALAVVRYRRDWDWAGGEREFLRAFHLHETHALARQWYAVFLAEQGNDVQARDEAARAIEAAPQSAPVHRTAGLVAFYAGRHADAERALRRALAIDPAGGVTRLLLAAVLLERGRPGDARALAAAVRDPELQDQRLALLAQVAVRVGDTTAASACRQQALALPGVKSSLALARFEAALGDGPGLIAVAARVVESRSPMAVVLRVHPVFRSVRGDPAFQALLQRVGL